MPQENNQRFKLGKFRPQNILTGLESMAAFFCDAFINKFKRGPFQILQIIFLSSGLLCFRHNQSNSDEKILKQVNKNYQKHTKNINNIWTVFQSVSCNWNKQAASKLSLSREIWSKPSFYKPKNN